MDIKALKNALNRTNTEKVCHRLRTPYAELPLRSEAPAYPRPAMVRDSFISLNGTWDCSITEGESMPALRPEGLPEGEKYLAHTGDYGSALVQNWKPILVPFCPESELSGIGHVIHPQETLWYRRTFTAPAHEVNERVLLHFGAVDSQCTVYVNGREIGSHEGGYLAFTLDITGALQTGENELIVRVSDETGTDNTSRGKQSLEPEGMFYTSVSGIWQTVWMEVVPSTYIERVDIVGDPDERSVTFRVFGPDGPAAGFQVEIAMPDYSITVGSADSVLTVNLPQVRLWSPEDPYLYSCTISRGVDQVKSYFAMRTVTCEKDSAGIMRICLNHKAYFENGVLDQGYYPESLYTAPNDDALIGDITAAKELGFNMIRMHAKVEEDRFYYHCDRLGMLVWQDMVHGGGPFEKVLTSYLPSLFPDFNLPDTMYGVLGRGDADSRRDWTVESLLTVKQLMNHPSIVCWVIFNEGWGQFDAAKLTDLVKRVDSTRLVDSASGWFDRGCGDLKSVHNYFRKLYVKKKKGDKRAFVISEFGGYSCLVPDHSMTDEVYGYHSCPDLEALDLDVKRLYYEQVETLVEEGLCAVVYTQLTDVETEMNGLLTYDRKVRKVDAVR